MKLAILAGQNSIHTIRWANVLAAQGQVNHQGQILPIDVHLLTMHPAKHQLHPLVTLHQLPHPAPWGYLLNIQSIKNLLQQIQPDILHVHYATGYGSLASLSGFHPQVLSVWGSDVYDFPQASPLHRWLVAFNLRQADWVCSTSHVMAKQTQSLYPELPYCSIIPFGVDTNAFYPQPQQRNPNVITIGTVKTLAPKYGIDTLILGFAALYRQIQSQQPELAAKLRLLLVGDGPQRQELEALVVQCQLSEQVIFAGFVPHPQVPDYLNQFDIYVASSRLDSESFGVAVIEASACGLPVVVTDVGGLPEVVLDQVTGLVVPREEPQALALALHKLLLQPDLRHQMGERGRQHVIDYYFWDACVTQMEEVYAKLLTV